MALAAQPKDELAAVADTSDQSEGGPTPAKPAKKPLSAAVLNAAAFVVAAGLAVVLAWALASVVEQRSAAAVTTRLLAEGYTWAHVATDGLIVDLSGTAPTEAMRFSAMNLAGATVDPGRLRDSFAVEPAKIVEAPRFSVEMLRNDNDVQLIGLLPEGDGGEKLGAAVKAMTQTDGPMDMLETALYPAPTGWDAALTFGIAALELLPRSKISVAAGKVVITAIASSEAEKRSFETDLRKAAPAGLAVQTTISAPRTVLTPFTLRFVLDADGARFDACSADTDKASDRITAAARQAGVKGEIICVVGLGVPSPSWAEATSAAIATLADLGAGTVTFSDADITLLAGPSVSQDTFDRAIGELRSALPDVFSLDAKMPEKVQANAAGPVMFTATKAAETHKVELRGRLTDDRVQAAVSSFAKARFGAANVHVATVLDPQTPDGWPERVLAGLQALAELDHGSLLVRPDTVEVSGVSGSQNASARISQLLSDRLGQGKTFKVDVSYDKALDPLAALPTPQDCIDSAHAVLAAQKISFGPGSAEIDAASSNVMNALAVALKNCTGVKIEIAGHTDAQGSAGGNLALSQARAEAVLLALQGRQVDVSGMRAVGYGEGVPIADNGSDAGREANRRIEFTLIGDGKSAAVTAASDAAPALVADAGPNADQTPAAPAAPDMAAPVVAPVVAPMVAPIVAPVVTPAATPPADLAATGPDFSQDHSPSLAPQKVTIRPKHRPAGTGG